MASLVDSLKDMVTPDMIGKVAGMLGESPDATRTAVGAAIPSILAGLLNTAKNNPGAAEEVIKVAKDNNLTDILGKVGGMMGGGAEGGGAGSLDGLLKIGASLLPLLLGSKQSGVTDLLGRLAGLKGGSMTSLLSLLAPLILGQLGKQLGGNFNASGLLNMLMGQKDAIAAAAPSGLAGAMGLAGLGDLGKGLDQAVNTARSVTAGATSAARSVENASSGLPAWLLPLVGLLALGLIGWYLTRGSAPAPEPAGGPMAGPAASPDPASRIPAEEPAPAPTEAAAALPDLTKFELPGGIPIELPAGSSLAGIVDFLKGADAPGTAKTFPLEGLAFEGDTTTLAPAASSLIEKLIAIVKAFTTAKVKLTGHAAEAEQPSILARLNALKELMTKAGIGAENVEVETAPPAAEGASPFELTLTK